MTEVSPTRCSEVVRLEVPKSELTRPELARELRDRVNAGQAIILSRVIDERTIAQIRAYLTDVGRGSLPSWRPLTVGCPDFHRVQRDDPRSYVKGQMHQFLFHPWNQNIFDFFQIFRDLYLLRNILGEKAPSSFLDATPADPFVSRLSFQFYPRGGGYLSLHADPVSEHQFVAPIVQMSRRGSDYTDGGLVVMDRRDRLIDVEEELDEGDCVLFSPQIPHGVETINPSEELNWGDFKGRWMALISVIKSQNNDDAKNAIEIQQR